MSPTEVYPAVYRRCIPSGVQEVYSQHGTEEGYPAWYRRGIPTTVHIGEIPTMVHIGEIPTMVPGYIPTMVPWAIHHPGIPSQYTTLGTPSSRTVYHDQGVRCAPLPVVRALGSRGKKALGESLLPSLKS